MQNGDKYTLSHFRWRAGIREDERGYELSGEDRYKRKATANLKSSSKK